MDPLPCLAHTMHGSWWLDDRNGASINSLRPRQNGCHFADDTFKRIFLNDNVRISIRISLKFVLYGPIYYIPALVQIMAWRRPGDKPLSEPMMVWLPTHICVTRPQYCPVSVGISRFQHQQTHVLRSEQIWALTADDTFECIFLNDNVRISIRISLKFVLYGPIYYIPALVQIMAWRRPGDKPLSEPMMVWLPTHICVTRPQYCPVSVGISRFQHQQTHVLRSEQIWALTADDTFECISFKYFFRLMSNFSEVLYIWFRHWQLAWHLAGHCPQNTDEDHCKSY